MPGPVKSPNLFDEIQKQLEFIVVEKNNQDKKEAEIRVHH